MVCTCEYTLSEHYHYKPIHLVQYMCFSGSKHVIQVLKSLVFQCPITILINNSMNIQLGGKEQYENIQRECFEDGLKKKSKGQYEEYAKYSIRKSVRKDAIRKDNEWFDNDCRTVIEKAINKVKVAVNRNGGIL